METCFQTLRKYSKFSNFRDPDGRFSSKMDLDKLIRTIVQFDVVSMYNVSAVTASVLRCYVDMFRWPWALMLKMK